MSNHSSTGEAAPVASGGYRIVRSTAFKPSTLALARTYVRLEDALADMGDGLVIAADGHIAAFHQRHERWVAALSTSTQPS